MMTLVVDESRSLLAETIMGRRGVLLDAELMLVVVFDQEIVAVFAQEDIEVQHRRLLRLALEILMLTSGLKDCGVTPSLESVAVGA